MPTNILTKIITDKKVEVEQLKKNIPLALLKKRCDRRQAPFDFARALSGDNLRLIAEVKKASPSSGVFHPDFDPIKLAKTYAQNGSSAISVLTEKKYFQGSINHLEDIRKEISIPLLRKDFIFDPYQIYESCAYGADALLLIASVLSREQLKELLKLSQQLGLSCLVEIHNEKEAETALHIGAEIIGINNRDLDTFTVDIDTTQRLRSLIPNDRIVVSESGIKSRRDIEKLKGWRINAILVGETLITSGNIPNTMRGLIL